MIFKILTEIFKIEVTDIIQNFKLKEINPSVSNSITLDFFIPAMKLGIEYQGEQHFFRYKVMRGSTITHPGSRAFERKGRKLDQYGSLPINKDERDR